jgi:hypothetical protein
METYYFSFGHGQTSKFTNRPLIDHHVRITGPDYDTCLAAMVAMFGQAWSWDYSSLEKLTGNGRFPSTEYLSITFGGDA